MLLASEARIVSPNNLSWHLFFKAPLRARELGGQSTGSYVLRRRREVLWMLES